MPLKKTISRIFGKPNNSGSETSTEDEYRKQHSKSFSSTLQSLVQKVTIRRRCCIFEVPSKMLVFLGEVGFFKEFKSNYPSLEIHTDIQDSVNGKLSLRGLGDMFDVACNECSWKLRGIAKSVLPAKDKRIWDAMANTRVQEHVKNVFLSKNIRAQVGAGETDKSIFITAMNAVELQRAKEVFMELIAMEDVFIPDEIDDFFQNENFQKVLTEQERSMALVIYLHPPNQKLEIVGIATAVTKAVSAFEQLFESMRIKKVYFTEHLSADMGAFLDMYFDDILKIQEGQLLKLKVAIRLEKMHYGILQFSMTGIEENFDVCKDMLKRIFELIVPKKEMFSLPGLKKFFSEKSGHDELKRISRDRRVYIKVVAGPSILTKPLKILRNTAFSHYQTQRCYDQCNYNTKEGAKLSWKYGRIENEKADVLVNSALSNLNNLTACGKALQERGGPVYNVECKRHTNIPAWDIVCTPGGNLSCQYVIHAVCCNWNNKNEESSEKALRNLLKKIFVKCIELDVSSLAMPTIGAGKHGFPEDLVFKILREEFEIICSQNLGKIALKHVSVIIFNDNQLHGSDQTPNLPNPRSQSLDLSTGRSFQPLQHQTMEQTANSQANSLHSSENNDRSINFGTANEIQMQFLGFQQDVEDAICDVKAFVNANMDRKSIKNIAHILFEHKSDLEQLSKASGVLVEWSLTGCMTVQGLKSDVADFSVQFAELQKKHELDLQNKKWLSEISQYFSAGDWVSFDDVTNKKIEAAYREDKEKEFDIIINGEDYHVDLVNLVKKSYASGQLFQIERTLLGDQEDSSSMCLKDSFKFCTKFRKWVQPKLSACKYG